MEYLVDGLTYKLSYKDLRGKYETFKNMSNKTFLENLEDALHLAVIISFVKEIPTEHCLGDRGAIHELVHLMKEEHTDYDIKRIRETFNQQLELA